MTQDAIKIASINFEGECPLACRPTASKIAKLVEFCNEKKVDILCVQESGRECKTLNCVNGLAQQLEWNEYSAPFCSSEAVWSNSILCSPEWHVHGSGATWVELECMGREGERWIIHNIHMDDEPYLPYQMKGVPYGDKGMTRVENVAQAVGQCLLARGAGLATLMSNIQMEDGVPEIIVGDFNEPSHLDLPGIPTPCSTLLGAVGFHDLGISAGRVTHPETGDRVDYCYGCNLCEVHHAELFDIGSDHHGLFLQISSHR